MSVALDRHQVEGLVRRFLLPDFDSPSPIPPCHRDWWELAASDEQNVVIAAPREHAKSSAITKSYSLAELLFRRSDHMMLLSKTWRQAVDHLTSLAHPLKYNEELKEIFGVRGFEKDREDEIIVALDGNHLFRVVAYGMDQEKRGLKWINKRVNLVVGDDIEDFQGSQSLEYRERVRRSFFTEIVPMGSSNCRFRLVGTIVHDDSLLRRLLRNKSWAGRVYEAHNDDFSQILWQERWPETRLRKTRDMFLSDGKLAEYNQEYRNIPIQEISFYFQKSDFLAQTQEDKKQQKIYYVSTDFGVTKTGDPSAIGVIGVDACNVFHVEHVYHGRWDSLEIVNKIFEINTEFANKNPNKSLMFFIEKGVIEKVLGPFLYGEMRRRNQVFNIYPISISGLGDKAARTQAIRAKHRAGMMKYNKEADWYPEFENELLRFTGIDGRQDDRVDMMSLFGIAMNEIMAPISETDRDDSDLPLPESWSGEGINETCGY